MTTLSVVTEVEVEACQDKGMEKGPARVMGTPTGMVCPQREAGEEVEELAVGSMTKSQKTMQNSAR